MKKTLLVMLILLGGSFLLPTTTHASFATSQLIDTSSSGQVFGNGNFFQGIGNGYTGYTNGFSIKFSAQASAGIGTYQMTMSHCDDSGLSVNCATDVNNVNDAGTIFTIPTGGQATTTFFYSTTTGISMNPAKFYKIGMAFSSGTSHKINVAGSNTDVFSGGNCVDAGGTQLVGLPDCYFTFTGQQTGFNNSNVSNLQPSNGSTTPSTSVALSMSYHAESSQGITQYTFILKDLTNFATGASSTPVLIQGTASTGDNSVSRGVTLISGHLYNLTGYVCNTSTATCYSGIGSNSFSVVTNYNTNSGSLFNGYGGLLSTSTPTCTQPTNVLDIGGGMTWALCQLFVPQYNVADQFNGLETYLITKAPFSYVGNIIYAYNNTTLSPDASTTSSINIAWSGLTCSGIWTGIGVATCDPNLKTWLPTNELLFSSTTMAGWIDPSWVSYLKSVAILVMYFSFGMYWFYRIKGIFDKKT